MSLSQIIENCRWLNIEVSNFPFYTPFSRKIITIVIETHYEEFLSIFDTNSIFTCIEFLTVVC